MEFKATIENFHTRLWSYHIKVPARIELYFKEKGVKRVVCKLNKKLDFQCAIMPAGDDVYFINVNKKIREQLQLKEGSQVQVQLVEDDSTYGLPMPDELKEVLAQDPEGDALFHQLTPGKQRNIIYAAGQVKNTDLRIQRAIVMIEHLKNNEGKINFKALYQELRTNTR
jgi:hypothetical protein